MQVVFDTNILVLYLIGDPSQSIIEAAFTDFPVVQLSFFYSDEMFFEYQDVLTRLTPRDPETFSTESVSGTLASIRRYGHLVHPLERLDACSHEPDNRFLECAVAAQTDYIVTVNTRHFPATFRGIQTVVPSVFHTILFG